MKTKIRAMVSHGIRADTMAVEEATINITSHRLAAGISLRTHTMPEVLLVVEATMITMKNLNTNLRKERHLADRLITAE